MDTLVRGDTVSRQQFDNAKAMRDSTAQKAESLHQRLALLQAGTRREDLQAAQERYRQAQAASPTSCSTAIAKKTSTQAAQRWTRPRHASTNSTCS